MDAFVYGTLTDPARVAQVVSEFEFVADATLDGLHRVEGEYPTLAPGGSVSGRVLRTPEVERLDAYEGVETGLYVRVPVPAAEFGGVELRAAESENRDDAKNENHDDPKGESRDAVEVYVGDPDALGADAAWPGEGPFPERVRRFVRDHEVVVRPRESE